MVSGARRASCLLGESESVQCAAVHCCSSSWLACSEDAKVVVADVNVEGGKAVADEINAAHGDDRAVFCEVNVKNVRGWSAANIVGAAG